MAPARTRREARARRRVPLTERFKAGARGEYEHRVRGVPDPPLRHRVPWTAPPPTLAGSAAWATTQAEAHAAAYARNAFLDDWALASRSGPRARRILVASWTVDRAGDPLARDADQVGAEPEPSRSVAGPADGVHRGAGHPGPTR